MLSRNSEQSTFSHDLLQLLEDRGILDNAEAGFVLECHINEGELGWWGIRPISTFLDSWPKSPVLIENPQSNQAYVAVISDRGFEVFEYSAGSAVPA